MTNENKTTADWWPSTRAEWLHWQKLVSDEHDRQIGEIERLRATLREIRRDIEEAADDVVWMRGGIETVHDRITAVLGDQHEQT